MDFLRKLFRGSGSAVAEGPAAVATHGTATEIGVLFDIEELGGGFYGWQAYKIIFKALDPKRLKGCTVLDGDTADTLAGRANHYCIAFQFADPAAVEYVRETLGRCEEKGLLPTAKRFRESIVREPLVQAGMIDSDGRLLVTQGSMIGSEWADGTPWTIVKR